MTTTLYNQGPLPWTIWVPDITEALGIKPLQWGDELIFSRVDQDEQVRFTQWLNRRVNAGTYTPVDNKTKEQWLSDEAVAWLLEQLGVGADDPL